MTLTTVNPAKTALVQTFTGNPILDTMIGHTLTAISAAVATACVVWADAHGWNPAWLAKDGVDLGVIVGGTVFATLAGAFSYGWAWLRTHRSQNAIIDGVVSAALTGVVPEAVAAKASAAQVAAVQASPTASVQ